MSLIGELFCVTKGYFTVKRSCFHLLAIHHQLNMVITAVILCCTSFYCSATPNKPITSTSISIKQFKNELTKITNNVTKQRASQVSSLIYRLDTQQVIFQHQATQYFQPASVQKILTAVAAQHVLGLDHHFNTQIRLSKPFSAPQTSKQSLKHNKPIKQSTENKDGIYNGDVLIRFGGDPLLSHQQLIKLLRSLSQLGIKKINGQVIIATNIKQHHRPSGWVWDDLGICYGAPITNGVVIDQNCIKASLVAENYNQTAKITLAAYPIDRQKAYKINGLTKPLLQFSSTAFFKKHQKTKTNSPDRCQLNLAPIVNGQYKVSGCYSNRLSLPLSLAINNPSQFAYAFVDQALSKLNISHQIIPIDQAISFDDQSFKSHFPVKIAEHKSLSSHALITQMLHHSNNVIAETLLNTMDQQLNPEGSFSPANTLTNVLAKLGLNDENANIKDGSGLSRYNLLNAKQLLAVLRYRTFEQGQLISQLPIAGESGTLRRKPVYLQSGIKHQLHGKSGSMLGVHNLIGVINSQHNGALLFVILENNISPKHQSQQSYVDAILTKLATLPTLQ